jgi:hypothetical protein
MWFAGDHEDSSLHFSGAVTVWSIVNDELINGEKLR